MRQSLHRYLVPLALLILHALLLLPVLVPYKPDNSIPESSLQLALNSARYAIPLGCLAFVAVALFRLIIGSKFPLSTRASRIEWVLLFFLGIVEEVIRWVLVRYLVKLEGGGGGYGAKHHDAKGHGLWVFYGGIETASVEVEPGIWEGIYLMGWVWSLLESLSMWWTLRPIELIESSSTSDVDGPTASLRSQSFQSWKKGHTIKRSTDSTIRTLRVLNTKADSRSSDTERGLFDEARYPLSEDNTYTKRTVMNKYDERASSPELSRRSVREEDNDAGDEETSATDNDNDPLDSPMTPTMYRPAYEGAIPTRFSRNATDDEDDEQEESTPTQQKHSAQFLPSGSITSESDYFGRRESRREPIWASTSRISPPKRRMSEQYKRLSVLGSDSETESPMSGIQTPLLSSSIPFDQEQQSLLEQPHNRNYGSTHHQSSALGNLPPPPPEMQMNRSLPANRPSITSHPSYISVATGDEAEDESDSNVKNINIGRAYPSHPAFSSSYIHTHFPSSAHSNTTCVPALPINSPWRTTRPKLPTAQSAPLRKGRSKKPRHLPTIGRQSSSITSITTVPVSRPCVNGVDVNSVSFMLAAFWITIAALQHTGYGLWFAWFPIPVFNLAIQWWSIVFFVGIAFSKGVYLAHSGTGWILSSGFLWPTTIACLISSFVLYFIVLVLWGVLW